MWNFLGFLFVFKLDLIILNDDVIIYFIRGVGGGRGGILGLRFVD